MGMKLKCLFVWMIAVAGAFPLSAQGLNATVKVHAQAVEGNNKQLFTSLEDALNSFIKGNRWSDLTGRVNEKIDLQLHTTTYRCVVC